MLYIIGFIGIFVIIVFLAMVKTIKESQRQNRD